jgi:hypothetical protein
MSTNLRDARQHAEKIEHYYKHGGTAAYSQARYHEIELGELLKRAHNSSHGSSDVPLIQAIIQGVRPKMDEMKSWEARRAT